MWEKLKRWFITHPEGGIISYFLVLMALIPVCANIPQWGVVGIGVLGCGAMISLLVWSIYKEKKEKKEIQNMTKLDMQEKWKEYVNVVNTTLSKQDKQKVLKDSWIEEFNNLMYHIAGNPHYIGRKLNDFDIASFLIYSLTAEQKEKENLRFAFECAKEIMRNPKVYLRHIGLGGELKIEVEGTIPGIKPIPFDEEITEEMAISIVKRYINCPTIDGVLQLSEFLHMLYRES